MASCSIDEFYDQLSERAANCAAERVRAFAADLNSLEVRADPGQLGNLKHIWFRLEVGAKEYPLLRVIAGYEDPLSPGWIQFKPRLKAYAGLERLTGTLELLLDSSSLFERNDSDGPLFFEVRLTDLDRPEVRKRLLEICKWFVEALQTVS